MTDIDGQLFHNGAALWGLLTLCFFEVSINQLTSSQFVHSYLRWLQFYFLDDYSNEEFSLEFNDSFWRIFLKLIATRSYEQACILLRRLLLDGILEEASVSLVELVLERLLEAPSPARVMADPELFDDWIIGNRDVFSKNVVESRNSSGLSAVIKMLSGNLDDVYHSLDWKEQLAAQLLYLGIPRTFDDVFVRARNFEHQECVLESLIFYSVLFDYEQVFDRLESASSVLPSWFAPHFLDVASRSELFVETFHHLFSEWAKDIFQTNDSMEQVWNILLDYLIASGDEKQLESVLSSLSESLLQEALVRYKNNPKILSSCRHLLSNLAKIKLQSNDYGAAYQLASTVGNIALTMKVFRQAVQDSINTNDYSILEKLMQIELSDEHKESSKVLLRYLVKQSDADLMIVTEKTAWTRHYPLCVLNDVVPKFEHRGLSLNEAIALGLMEIVSGGSCDDITCRTEQLISKLVCKYYLEHF